MSHGSDTAACDVPAVPTKIPAASATVAPADSSAFIKCRSRDRRITVNLFRSCGGVTRMPEGPGLDREFRARTTVACSEEHAARTSTSQAATNSSSVSANNSVNQVERMLASECVRAPDNRDYGITATTARPSHGHPGHRPDRSAEVRTEEVGGGRGNGKRAGQGGGGCPGHARRYLALTPADTHPYARRYLTLTPADT